MEDGKTIPEGLISQAIAMVFEAACKANGCDVPYCGSESVLMIPLDRLEATRTQFLSAKSRIEEGMNQLMLNLSLQLNHTSPIHRLPSEVLTIIFQEFKPGRQVSPDTNLFDLTGHTALALLRSNPQPIHVELMPKLRGSIEEWKDVLDALVRSSERFKDLEISRKGGVVLPLGGQLQGLQTPRLERLRVTNHVVADEWPLIPLAITRIRLSNGTPLKHLDLTDCMAYFDSPYLSGLKVLILTGYGHRDTSDLLRTLTFLHQLEVLWIFEIAYWSPRRKMKPNASTQVTLPHLRSLVLADVQSNWSAEVLGHLNVPLCFDILVHDVTPDRSDYGYPVHGHIEDVDDWIWQPGNLQASLLLGAAESTPDARSLSIDVNLCMICIRSDVASRRRDVGRIFQNRDTAFKPGYINLAFKRRDPTSTLKRIASVMLTLPSCPAINLDILSDCFNENKDGFGLLPWSEHLIALTVRGATQCRAVLQQLSQRHFHASIGEEDWICPKLSAIRLSYGGGDGGDPGSDSDALLALVQRRWSRGDGLSGALQPVSFVMNCDSGIFPDAESLEKEIRSLVPSFRFSMTKD
ncbi:hypothetical protein FRB90_011457 [Tulasnella sp. 427]|nr:hypothetical protein FRB90_011457 [Tulasnella sp. 427]